MLAEALYLPPAPQPQLPLPQPPVTTPTPVAMQADEQEEKLTLIETATGYALFSSKSNRQTQATNYLLNEVVQIHHIKNGGADERLSVQLRIRIVPSSTLEKVEIDIAELDSVVTKIGRTVGSAIVYPGVKSSFCGRFSVLVRERLSCCQHQYVYEFSGWVQAPQGVWTYVRDGVTPPFSNILFKSGFSFGTSRTIRSTNWLVQNSWRLLSLSQDPSAILVPFLFAHLSLLWSLFNAAGYPPHVLLFIKGTTGSLKTALASLLFNFSGDPQNNIPASFRDTSASMEVRMAKYRDRVLLIDDFCPAASENARRILEQNLEQVVRFYGDGIAKARTNPKMEEVHEKRPCGLCAITGEDTAGSYSSLLRCLFITVKPDTFDKILLAEFQKEPVLWTEYLSRFVDFCIGNAPKIIDFVQSKFPIYREKGGQVITERRLADAYADLCLAANVVVQFACQNSVVTPEAAAELLTQFDGVLLETYRRSAEEAQTVDPAKVFARLLIEGIDKRTILIGRKEEFRAAPDKFHGYTDEDYWYFWGSKLYDTIRREYALQDRQFPLTQNRLWESLLVANILVPGKSRDESGGKFEYGVKVSFGNRPRLIRIDPKALSSLL